MHARTHARMRKDEITSERSLARSCYAGSSSYLHAGNDDKTGDNVMMASPRVVMLSWAALLFQVDILPSALYHPIHFHPRRACHLCRSRAAWR